MAAVKTRKNSVAAVREHAKRDHSPKWDGAETWTPEQFNARFREAMNYYNLNHSAKDLKPKVIDWMGRNGFERDEIARFKKTKDWRCNSTMGAIAACLIRGMPAVHKGFNNGKDTAAWLTGEIRRATVEGQYDAQPVEEVKADQVQLPPVSIQDRIRDQAVSMSEEIDQAIDGFIQDPDSFDPKAFKMASLLRTTGAKAAQARYIKSFYEKGYAELMELSSGEADEQLREAYRHHPRRNIRKLIEFYESIFTACDQIAAEAKVLKKPRAKKVKPAEELVKKIKFRVSDDKLSITSVPPAQMIGAQGMVVYNLKSRKIGYYIARSTAGFGVKGASLENFTEKSVQKTLRNPAQQVKEFKEQNTQKRFETWFAKNLKTTETALTGRFNEDVVILKVFK